MSPRSLYSAIAATLGTCSPFFFFSFVISLVSLACRVQGPCLRSFRPEHLSPAGRVQKPLPGTPAIVSLRLHKAEPFLYLHRNSFYGRFLNCDSLKQISSRTNSSVKQNLTIEQTKQTKIVSLIQKQ